MAITTPLPFLFGTTPPPKPLVPYVGMLLLEAGIGAYFPAMGTVKSTVVPEHQRSAIYNVFRLPLNLIVLLNLAVLGNMTHVQSFLLCGVMLGVATVLQYQLTQRLLLLGDATETGFVRQPKIGSSSKPPTHEHEMSSLAATSSSTNRESRMEEEKEDVL